MKRLGTDSLLLANSRGKRCAVVGDDEREAACGYLSAGEDGLVDSPPVARSADPDRPVWQLISRIASHRTVARHSCSWPALTSLTRSGALGLVAEEALLDGFVYDDIRSKDRSLTRFRLVKLPLTGYLEWEFWNYRVREGLGEVVRIVDRTGAEGDLRSSSCFDFLLFDDSVALIHDYGTAGLQVGGWLVSSRDVLDRLGRTVADLREQSVALEGFISAHQLRLAEWLG